MREKIRSFLYTYARVCLIICVATVIGCRNQVSLTGALKTGWYHVVDSSMGIEKELESDTSYYLDPEPVITSHNFASMVVKKPIPDMDWWELVVQLDDAGKEAFKTTTAKSIKRDLAFIVDDELFSVVRIQATIPNGILSLSKRSFTKTDAEILKAKIEAGQMSKL